MSFSPNTTVPVSPVFSFGNAPLFKWGVDLLLIHISGQVNIGLYTDNQVRCNDTRAVVPSPLLCRYGTNSAEVWHHCCGGMALILWRYGTNAAEVVHHCCGGMAQMLWRYGTNALEVWHHCCEGLHQCCGGMAAMLWRYETNAAMVWHQ